MRLWHWLIGKKKEAKMTDEHRDATLEQRLVSLERFWFLADAPMFIDGEMVERLHDAIFRPEVELASRSEAATGELAGKVASTIKAAAELEAKMPPALALFGLDILKAKANFEGSLTGEGSGRRSRTDTETYVAVKSTERYLESLVSLYAQKYSDRIFWIDKTPSGGHSLNRPGTLQTWEEMERTLDRPGARPLVILDLAKGSKLMPMQGELTNGKDCELVKDYLEEQAKKTEEYPLPKYPSSRGALTDVSQARSVYWLEVNKRFESQAVLRAIEGASGGERARFDWIDFRVLFDADAGSSPIQPPHLHFVARGAYPTGTFAYQLVRRAERHGVRIVGTLKKGQDINVLAVYER